jgi:predicted Zn-dependent protease
MKFFFISLLLIIFENTFSFSGQKTSTGTQVKWKDLNSSIRFNVDTSNSSGISENAIKASINSTLNSWTSSLRPSVSINYTSDSDVDGENDIRFSSNSLFFGGSSVLAVTQNTFNADNGRILESDIVIKNSVFLSENTSSQYYIGNIVSHEFGHSLGLSHSTNLFSTMFYKLTKGQHTSEEDDRIGLKNIYTQSLSNEGSIRGTIAGGSSVTPVFGATVKLISSNNGKVLSSTLSDENGFFSFDGLEIKDVYYIYVEPTKLLSTIADYYSNTRSDYCSGFASYEGSFYETCNSERRGKPQGIKLSSTGEIVNLGTITIKCGMDVPVNYFSSRGGSGYDLGDKSTPGDSMVGFFTNQDVQSGEADEINFDLSNYSVTRSDLYLDVKLVYHDLYSESAYEMEVTSPVTTETVMPSIDVDGNPKLNMSGKYSLDNVNQFNNVFTIKISPKLMSDYLLSSTFSTTDDVLPDYSNLKSNRAFYQVIVNVVKKVGSDYELYEHYPYLNNKDNSTCMQATKTYGVKAEGTIINTESTVVENLLDSDSSAVACGSVAFVDGSGPGPGSWQIILGFLLSLMLMSIKRLNNDIV